MGVRRLIRIVLSSLGRKLKVWGPRIRERLGAKGREDSSPREAIEGEPVGVDAAAAQTEAGGPPPGWAERVSRGPPSHWLELVRSRAPQLLRPQPGTRGSAVEALRGPSSSLGRGPSDAAPELERPAPERRRGANPREGRHIAPPASRAAARTSAEPPDLAPPPPTELGVEAGGQDVEGVEQAERPAIDAASPGSASPSGPRVGRRHRERFDALSIKSGVPPEVPVIRGEGKTVEGRAHRSPPPKTFDLDDVDRRRRIPSEPAGILRPPTTEEGEPVSRSTGPFEHSPQKNHRTFDRHAYRPRVDPSSDSTVQSVTAERRTPERVTGELADCGKGKGGYSNSTLVEPTDTTWSRVLDETQSAGWATCESGQPAQGLWPELPDVVEPDPDPLDNWAAALREWTRRQRLDMEQRGTLWSE